MVVVFNCPFYSRDAHGDYSYYFILILDCFFGWRSPVSRKVVKRSYPVGNRPSPKNPIAGPQKPGFYRNTSLQLRCCTIVNKPFMNGQDARSTRKSTLCVTGILPVLENGARCELQPTDSGKNPVSWIIARRHLPPLAG